MDKHLFTAIVQAGWRRRYLIMWPLMILLPVSLVVAWMMPRQYQATALIMIPEAPGFGSSQTGYAYSQDMAAKMKGIDALLKSDFILADVLSRESDARRQTGAINERVDELRKRLVTKQVSDNFVQVTLNGGEKEGLGDQLNSVLASLFEGLLTPTQSANDAVTFVARQRQAEIEAIERRIKDVEAREPKLTEAMVRDHVNAGNSAEDRIAAKQRLLDSDRARLQREIEGIVGASTARIEGSQGRTDRSPARTDHHRPPRATRCSHPKRRSSIRRGQDPRRYPRKAGGARGTADRYSGTRGRTQGRARAGRKRPGHGAESGKPHAAA